ncbi:hypothetical protein EYB35_07320 [Bacillus paranthracis]|nr:hypothetical protein EYB35_07320 [Bacillus paranthracis]
MRNKWEAFKKHVKNIRNIKFRISINVSPGWSYRALGLILTGVTWRYTGYGEAWYSWLLFLVGFVAGMHFLDKGYDKFYRGGKK